eukprot:COSAG01_NODE_1895_length_8971_cov_127.287083_3_plen_84_part_00
MVRDHDPRLYYRLLLGPRGPPPIIWSTRRFGCGWQQPRTTRIIAERLFYATIGYQRMQAVMSDPAMVPPPPPTAGHRHHPDMT